MVLDGRLNYNRVVIESYRLYCTANVHNLQGTQICNLTRGVPGHLRFPVCTIQSAHFLNIQFTKNNNIRITIIIVTIILLQE